MKLTVQRGVTQLLVDWSDGDEAALEKLRSWRQIDDVFESALARDPEYRAPFLDEACACDHELRRVAAC